MSPVVADIDSGMFDRNTAATTATPTWPPPIRLMPMAADSGMPSSSAPSTRAAPLDAAAPEAAFADPPDAALVSAFGSGRRTPPWTGLLRRCPPRRSISQSPVKKVTEPAARPSAAAMLPAER